MSDNQRIGQINAVIYAAEEVINRSQSDKGTILLAKETAYDQIKKIMAGKSPWEGEEK